MDRKDCILTIEQWMKIKQDFNFKCAYCGEELLLTMEHFVALNKGGEYTKENIIPVCGSCNFSKCDREFEEWYHRQEFYSKKRESFIYKYLGYKHNQQ